MYFGLDGLTFRQVLALIDRSQIDASDSLGKTVLSWAANRGDSQTVAELLAIGADPNKQDKHGWTPLYFAVRKNEITSEVLLNAKADSRITSSHGATPLHGLGRNNACLIRGFVELGVDINRKNVFSSTALYHASSKNFVHVVQEPLANGADINAATENRCDVIFHAVYCNHHQTLSTLISNKFFDSSVMGSFGWDVPMYATAFGDVHTLNILRDKWPAGIDLGRSVQVYNAYDIAQHRRYKHEKWSHIYSMPPDPDPIAWLDAFEDMVCTSEERQARKYESEDLACENETWKDAREQFEDT